MSSEHLNSLAKTGLLKPEPPDQTEFNGLVESGTKRLKDACNEANSTEGRFDCAYRGRRPRCPAHGDHVIRSMTTGAAHELDGAVGFIF
jgi:hypothetical protein